MCTEQSTGLRAHLAFTLESPENQKLVEITAKTQTHKHNPAGRKQILRRRGSKRNERTWKAGWEKHEMLWVFFSQWGSVAHGAERIEMDCSVLFHWFLCGGSSSLSLKAIHGLVKISASSAPSALPYNTPSHPGAVILSA